MSKGRISYEKVYTDDTGKKIPNISHDSSVTYTIKKMWNNVVDGFYSHENTDLSITVICGNIRVVLVADESSPKFKFEQYFLSEMDGKVLVIPYGVKYAIQNIDEGKSTYLAGTEEEPEYEYANKGIFNWRKKQP